jgi:hypothetical protein
VIDCLLHHGSCKISPRSVDNPWIVTVTATALVVTNHRHLLSRASPMRSQFTSSFRLDLFCQLLLLVTAHFNHVFIKKNKSYCSFSNTSSWLVFQLKNNIPERNHLCLFWNQCCCLSVILAAFKMYPIDVLHHIYHFPHRDLPSSQDEASCIAIANLFKDFCNSFSVSIRSHLFDLFMMYQQWKQYTKHSSYF